MPTPIHPLVIGHRGASGHALENTLSAFRLCVDNPPTRCDGVELDIHTTADGEIVVHHDPVLKDGRAIAELPWAALQQVRLSNGEPIPTLAQALEVLAPIEVFIEAKALPAQHDGRLLALMRCHPHPDRLHVHAFDHRIIRRLSATAPEFGYGVLSGSHLVDNVQPARNAGARTLWQHWEQIDQALVEECAAAGVRIIAWTVNSAETARQLAGWGVAGLCGNWPERIRTAHP